MGVDIGLLRSWLDSYDPENITIGVVASHSSLQILHGARMEGFRTLGIAVGEIADDSTKHSQGQTLTSG